jgi:hypothetical protein
MHRHRTGYINYRDTQPDPRLLKLQEIWTSLGEDGRLPAFTADTLAAFPDDRDHASLVEIRHEGPKRRYFVVQEGPAVIAAVGLDGTGTYVDDVGDTPEFTTILTSDYDGIVASKSPRFYAEEQHLDGRRRDIMGIQLPFAADGENVDVIVEFVYPLAD